MRFGLHQHRSPRRRLCLNDELGQEHVEGGPAADRFAIEGMFRVLGVDIRGGLEAFAFVTLLPSFGRLVCRPCFSTVRSNENSTGGLPVSASAHGFMMSLAQRFSPASCRIRSTRLE